MNLKNLFAVSLAALTLLSCTKEIIKEVPIDKGDIETGSSFVKFTLDANMVKTRAEADHYDEKPTADENKIYNYGLFIFKSNGMLEATLVAKSSSLGTPLEGTVHQGELTFTKAMNPNLEWNDTEDAIRISAGAKTFFAIVNAPYEYIENQGSFINNPTLTLDELKEITLTLGGELNKIVGAYNQTGDIVHFENDVNDGDNRGFMMTNIIADGQSEGFYRRTLEETDEDNPVINHISVIVGRAMAKVSLASDLKTYTEIQTANDIDFKQPYGTLDPLAYKIINNPNEMNVALNVSRGVVMTPYISSALNTNNYFVSNNTSHETSPAGPNSYYIPVSKKGINANDNANKTFNYCIENANNKPLYGNASIVLIKGHYTPLTGDLGRATILDANSDVVTTSLEPGNSFWRIWIKPYTASNGDPQGGVYAEEYFTASPDPDAYRAYKNWITDPADPNYVEIELEVWEYPQGLCYYYLPLKNDASNSPFTVVRNSYYRIDIDSVDGAGHPEDPDKPGEPGGPDKPDPTDPLEPQTLLNASIKVSDWDIVDQPGKL